LLPTEERYGNYVVGSKEAKSHWKMFGSLVFTLMRKMVDNEYVSNIIINTTSAGLELTAEP